MQWLTQVLIALQKIKLGSLDVGTFQKLSLPENLKSLWQKIHQAKSFKEKVKVPKFDWSFFKSKEELDSLILFRRKQIAMYEETQKEALSFLHKFHENPANFSKAIALFPSQQQFRSFKLIDLYKKGTTDVNKSDVIIPVFDESTLGVLQTYCQYNDSRIFRNLIDESVETTEYVSQDEDEPDIIIDIVIEEIVKPAILKFENVSKQFQSCSMSLAMVKKLFVFSNGDPNIVNKELEILENVNNDLLGRKWWEKTAKKVNQYFKRKSLSHVAQILEGIRNICRIENVFKELNDILSSSNDQGHAMKMPLSSLTESEISSGEIFACWTEKEIYASLPCCLRCGTGLCTLYREQISMSSLEVRCSRRGVQATKLGAEAEQERY